MRAAATLGVFGVAFTKPMRAQTDFYNTSVGRPLRIEDASPVEYRAIELDVAPLRFEQLANSRRWSLHPEATLSVLPRTQLQLAVPLTYHDAGSTSPSGVAGVEISALHALNAETSIPAFAVAADVSLPVGSLGGSAAYGTLKGIMTRTFPWARVHANAQITAGPSQGSTSSADQVDDRDLSRWLAGLAIDKTFPLRSLLVSAEAFAEQPLNDAAQVAWSAGAGLRYQLAPRWAFDAGVGRRFTGDDRTWYATLGSAYAFGLR